MKKQTVFIKRYPSKGDLPKESGNYITNIGELKYYNGTLDWSIVNKTSFDGSDDRLPKYWLEEIELPSVNDCIIEENKQSTNERAIGFEIGVNFILNKLGISKDNSE